MPSTKKPRIVEPCATQLVALHLLAAETWRLEHLSKRSWPLLRDSLEWTFNNPDGQDIWRAGYWALWIGTVLTGALLHANQSLGALLADPRQPWPCALTTSSTTDARDARTCGSSRNRQGHSRQH